MTDEPTPNTGHHDLPKSAFGGINRRSFALSIDSLVVFLFVAPILHFSLHLTPLEMLLSNSIPVQLVTAAISAAYFIPFIAEKGTTLGKFVCRLKVVRMDGGRVTYRESVMRYAPYLVFFGVNILLEETSGFSIPDFFWFAGSAIVLYLDRYNRAPHDLFAGTAVILRNP